MNNIEVAIKKKSGSKAHNTLIKYKAFRVKRYLKINYAPKLPLESGWVGFGRRVGR
jgi:hypothetical protein